jgi:hypothetical protein
MKQKKKPNLNDLKKGLIDIEKLKEFGITKDPTGNGIEEIDGENITGGKNEEADPTVATHWPTGK